MGTSTRGVYRVWLRWVARPEFARAECLSCQSQPSLFRAKESPLNIEIIGLGKISVTFASKDLNTYSVAEIIALCNVRLSNCRMSGYYWTSKAANHHTGISLIGPAKGCMKNVSLRHSLAPSCHVLVVV